MVQQIGGNMKITRAQGNGYGQCTLCKKRGKWNVQWMCFLYKIEGKEGVYCKNCADELKIQIGELKNDD